MRQNLVQFLVDAIRSAVCLGEQGVFCPDGVVEMGDASTHARAAAAAFRGARRARREALSVELISRTQH